MFYFRFDNLSKNLLIRAAAMGVTLAALYQLQLFTEKKSFDRVEGDWSSIASMMASPEGTKLELPY